jgi:hypothetical protein
MARRLVTGAHPNADRIGMREGFPIPTHLPRDKRSRHDPGTPVQVDRCLSFAGNRRLCGMQRGLRVGRSYQKSATRSASLISNSHSAWSCTLARFMQEDGSQAHRGVDRCEKPAGMLIGNPLCGELRVFYPHWISHVPQRHREGIWFGGVLFLRAPCSARGIGAALSHDSTSSVRSARYSQSGWGTVCIRFRCGHSNCARGMNRTRRCL